MLREGGRVWTAPVHVWTVRECASHVCLPASVPNAFTMFSRARTLSFLFVLAEGARDDILARLRRTVKLDVTVEAKQLLVRG